MKAQLKESVIEKIQKMKLERLAISLFFVIYFFIGLSVFRDYGISTDEEIQRQHSLIVYKYINQKVFQREIEALSFLPDLEEYDYKHYGVTIQMPLVFVEELHNFQMPTRQLFLMRHLYNFLVCFLGYICFYFALKKIFRSSFLALMGAIFVSLYPRFFGNQFFDIKNMIFAALNMITLLTLVNVVEKYNWRNVLLFSFAAALTTNQRIMGIFFPVILVGYFFVSEFTKLKCLIYEDKHNINQKEKNFLWKYLLAIIKKIMCVIGTYFLAWFLLTPAAWSNPIQVFGTTSERFAHWSIGTMAFGGELITSDELPWYYLFVWFGISIPLLYLILFVLGHAYAVSSLFKSRHKWNDIIEKQKWLTCMLALFWGSVGSVIVLKAWIHTEWRHMYFVFMPFCGIAVYGLKYLLQLINKKVVYGMVAICMLLQLLWMVRNHPYQYVYFNVVGRHVASEYDRDSWRVATCDMLKWILEHEDGQQAKIQTRPIDYNMFTDDEKSRLYIISDGSEQLKYIIENYRIVVGNTVEYDGYEEVYAIWVDGFKIGSVFQMIE